MTHTPAGREPALCCPRCREREDLLVRVATLCSLIRDDDGRESIALDDKAPTDFEWTALHCGSCGHEGPRDDFEGGEGLPPDRSSNGTPGRPAPPTPSLRAAIDAFIETIEATGGCVRPGRGAISPQGEELIDFEDDRPVPAGDESWPDLADAYLLACRALGRAPLVQDADADEIPVDGEDAGGA